jgi:RNA polymerase sigma-70 factor (ECF subfamily)
VGEPDSLSTDFDLLLARARQGDQVAQGELLQRMRGMLRGTAERRMDARLGGRIDASDIVQQTYVTALTSFSQFTGSRQAEFVAWVQTVHDHVLQNFARHHVHTKKRSVKRENRVTSSGLVQLSVILESTPSQKVAQGESLVRLMNSLDALPDDQREAVRLRYCDGWPLERIAKEMNRSMPSVAGLLKRGLRAMRTSLGIEK